MTDSSRKKSYRTEFAILIAVFIAVAVISVVIGRYSISIGDFFRLVFSKLSAAGGIGSTDLSAEKVLFEIRLPRIAAALLIGSALSLAGVSYQGMFRNPLVSPDILGASTGAGFGAALAILWGCSYYTITLSAFIFGIAAVTIAYAVSRLSRANETLAMILSGMVVSSLFSAGTSFIKLVADTDDKLPAITYWLMGMLSSIKTEDLKFIIIPMAVGMIPLFLLRWRLNLLTVEDQTSRSLGVNITALRLAVVVCATLLTAASVSVSGMIGWVGLVVPHICRMIFGYDYKRLIPATAIFGATFLLIVDDLARTVTTGELPIGILTSFVGAPLFLYLLVSGGSSKR